MVDERKTDMQRKLLSFDWALKRVLRISANFGVLEGFLSELLATDVTILEVLEGESNQERAELKYYRVDVKVRLASGEVVIIEVQAHQTANLLQRILFCAWRVVTEHISTGEDYEKVVKVNILHFGLDEGPDYVYRGTTTSRGIHHGDELGRAQVFPDYYLLKVNRFGDVARTTLDEWIFFLKNQEIRDGLTAKGLALAKAILSPLLLTDDAWRAHQRHEDELHDAATWDVSQERLLATHDDDAVATLTGLPPTEVARLRAEDRGADRRSNSATYPVERDAWRASSCPRCRLVVGAGPWGDCRPAAGARGGLAARVARRGRPLPSSGWTATHVRSRAPG